MGSLSPSSGAGVGWSASDSGSGSPENGSPEPRSRAQGARRLSWLLHGSVESLLDFGSGHKAPVSGRAGFRIVRSLGPPGRRGSRPAAGSWPRGGGVVSRTVGSGGVGAGEPGEELGPADLNSRAWGVAWRGSEGFAAPDECLVAVAVGEEPVGGSSRRLLVTTRAPGHHPHRPFLGLFKAPEPVDAAGEEEPPARELPGIPDRADDSARPARPRFGGGRRRGQRLLLRAPGGPRHGDGSESYGYIDLHRRRSSESAIRFADASRTARGPGVVGDDRRRDAALNPGRAPGRSRPRASLPARPRSRR